MRCPARRHTKSRIIRTRPDPENEATDHVGHCQNTACLTVFNSREALISIVDGPKDREILLKLANGIAALPADSRQTLLHLIETG